MALRYRILKGLGLLWLAAAPSTSAQDLSPVQFLTGDETTGPAAFEQGQPEIVRGGSQYLVVWTDYRTGGSNLILDEGGADIMAARLDAAGALIDTTPIVVNQDAADQTLPRVAWNGTDWLVVWHTQAPTQFFWASGIRAARISASGAVLDAPPIEVFSYPFSSSADFAVAADGAGWLVTMRGSSAGEDDLLGVRIAADGTVLDPGGVTLVNASFTLIFNMGLAFATDEYLLTYVEGGVLKGLRLDPALVPLDPAPFTINSNSSSVESPRVASDGTDFFTIWRSFSSGTQIAQVKGARVTHAGVVLDPTPIKITPFMSFNGEDTRVAWDGTNWVTTFRLGGISAARVAPDGTVLDFGGVPVNPEPGVTITEPAIAGAAAGGIQVVWKDNRAGGPFPDDISTFTVSADLVPAGSAVVSMAVPAQTLPDVATDADGYMVAYRSRVSGEDRIMAVPLDAAGTPLFIEPLLLYAGENLGRVAVAWNGSLYLVVWTDFGPVGSSLDDSVVWGQRLLPDGTLVDAAPFVVMEGFNPDVAAVGDLFFVVDIQQTLTSQVREPFGIRVRGTDGALLDTPIDLGSSFAGQTSVTALGGRWLATWQRNFTHDDPNAEVRAAIVDTNGVAGAEFVVSTSLNPFRYDPAVASDGTDALVIWEEGDISGARVLADGTVLPGFTVSAANEDRDEPALAWDGTQFVSLYADRRNNTFFLDERSDVFGTRVDAAGTVVDPGGFAVFEAEAPNINPSVTGAGGTALLAAAVFRPEAPYVAYRVGYRFLGVPVTDLTVSLAPVNPPIVVPPEGGSFQYTLTVMNTGATSRTFDLWIEMTGPGFSRTLGPFTRTLAPGGGFQRTLTQNVPGAARAGTYTQAAHVGAFPTPDASDSFTWEKAAAKAGRAAVVFDWTSNVAEALAAPSAVPDAFTLGQNYPNPFNPTTTITFDLPAAAPVRLTVYDVLGRAVTTLKQGMLEAGRYTVRWDGRAADGTPVAGGLYLYRLEAGRFTQTRTMMLVK